MKKALLILGILLLPILASAAYPPVTNTLFVGEEMDAWGRVIRLDNVGEDRVVIVTIDNETTVIFTDWIKTEGLEINVTDTIWVSEIEGRGVKLIVTVNWIHECDTDADCVDEDNTTIDRCQGNPRQCTNYFLECESGDNICPTNCTYNEDHDCTRPCDETSDCDDNNASTYDYCTGDYLDPGSCVNEIVFVCREGDTVCPQGCIWTADMADTKRDTDCLQTNDCSTNKDCNDNNASTIDTCAGDGANTSRYCSYSLIGDCISNDGACPAGCTETTDSDCPHQVICGDNVCEGIETCSSCSDCACSLDTTCVNEICTAPELIDCSVGERDTMTKASYFCSDAGWKLQKAGGTFCSADYECQTNQCEGDPSICKSSSEVSSDRNKKLAAIALIIFLISSAVYLFALRKTMQERAPIQ